MAYLADHEDPEVREILASALRRYRGREARRLRERLRLLEEPESDD
ncbi:hypothetical protein QEZ54_09570 [Catellatospora sp. KI3]|nr:hypothetical protein [Catellatospora sp. KI3]MDI1461214.1 hypothetical protein [Catellatospora sp. KI3]